MANIALSINESNVLVFDPYHLQEAKRLDSNRTLLIFPDGSKLEVKLPQDILFVCLRGRKELPKWHTFSGFRVRCRWEGGPIWRIAIHPFEDPKLLLEAMFRSQDFAIFQPPLSGVFMPKRLDIIF
jgi:hypothetical protein